MRHNVLHLHSLLSKETLLEIFILASMSIEDAAGQERGRYQPRYKTWSGMNTYCRTAEDTNVPKTLSVHVNVICDPSGLIVPEHLPCDIEPFWYVVVYVLVIVCPVIVPLPFDLYCIPCGRMPQPSN